MSLLPLIVIQVLIFIALVAVLRRVLTHNVTDASARLQGLSAEYTQRQEELKARLSEAERQYQEQITHAKTEADRIVTEARQEADSTKTKLLEEARVESERIVKQGLEAQEGLKKEFEREVDRRAVERACELLQEALPADLRRDMQSRWLDELFHNGLAEFDRLKKEEHVRDVKVVSALALSKEQREKLHTRLKGRLARDITLKESVDERLVAGLMITVGSLVFDGSLVSKVKKAIRQAKESA